MPKCAKCGEVLPPQFITEIEGAVVAASQCIFCKLDTNTINLPPDDTGRQKTYTKDEARKEYQILLRKLKDKLKTREDLKKFMKGEY